MKNRKDIKLFLDHCIEQRRVLPQISKLQSNNWDELDEQIHLLTHYLETGTIPTMDQYNESLTDSIALYLLGYNTIYDELIEELTDDNRS